MVWEGAKLYFSPRVALAERLRARAPGLRRRMMGSTLALVARLRKWTGPLYAHAVTRPRSNGHRAALVLVLLLSGPAGARADWNPPLTRMRPLILHLEGTWAGDREAAARSGFAAVSFGIKGEDPRLRRWLGVDEVHPLGDYPVLGKDILDDVLMYDPSFFVTGSRDLVTALLDTKPGTRIVLEALADRASRTFYLRSVDRAGPRP
jgi:hypothetical protein